MVDLPERCAPLVRWGRGQPVELVGPPGIGKSWVAKTWAWSVGDVVFVSLDGVRTAEGVVHELAVQLDLDADEQAFRALEARSPTAWVLDDAEAAAEGLRDLQPRFPDVPLVVTSRRRIGLSRSAVVDVGPLPAADAFQLFVDRAREARHGFDPEPHSDAIAALCVQLDGLPLAIELAAARVRVLSPSQILDRLSLDHLADRRRTGRHHSLRHALSTTVDALSDEATRMLSVASGFQRAFSLEALEAVGAGGFDALEELMDAGLLQRGSADMLRLLGPVRSYAAELPGRPDLGMAVHRWLVDEAERRVPWKDPGFWSGWRPELERAVAAGGTVGARAAVVLGRREELFGPTGGQRGRVGPLLHDPSIPVPIRAALHRSVGVESLVLNDYEQASRSLGAALALEPEGRILGELLLAKSQMVSDHRVGEDPGPMLDRALQAWPTAEGRAEVALIRSIDRLRRGAVDDAVRAADDAVAATVGQDLAPLQAVALAFLADAERHAGVAAVARLERLERAIALDVAPPKYRALVATKHSTALADAGRFAEAIAALDEPTRRLEEAGDRLYAVGHRLLQVAFALARGDISDAQRRLEAIPGELPHYAGVLRTLRSGQVAHATGDVATARAAYSEVEALDGEGFRALRDEAAAFRAAVDGERAEGLLDGALERAHSGPELHAWVDARGRWEARLLARLLRPPVRVASHGRWFQVGSQRHELGRKATLARVLAGLAARTGRPVPVDEVLAFGWPGESPRGASGRARVHVAISSLRKLGLQGALWTAPGDELAYVLEAEQVED